MIVCKAGRCQASAMALACALLSAQAGADESLRSQAAIDDQGLIEEVVVTAKQPQWRTKTEAEDWRPKRFTLPEKSAAKSMQWLPEYNRDERDNYDGVRDRTNEKPEFKLFNWKF